MAKAWTCTYRGSPAVRWTTPEGRVRTRRCPSAKVAKELCEAANRAILLEGDFIPADEQQQEIQGPDQAEPVELLTAGDAWIDELRRSLAARTIENYAQYLDLLAAWCAVFSPGRPMLLGELSKPFLSKGWAWLMDPANGRHGRARAPATAAKVVEVWILFWKWAAEQDEYTGQVPPPRSIDLPRRPEPSPMAWTWGQAAAMLAELRATAPEWTIRTAELAWYLGERRDALLRLEWGHVDLARRRLVIPAEITKGAAGGRTIPLHEDLLARLKSWGPGPQRARLVEAPALELSGRGHVDRTVRRAWERAGVPAEVWHGQPLHGARACLRTHLAARNVSPVLIDAYLGHKSPGTGGRHYTDRAALVIPLRPVVALIPAIGSVEPDPSGRVEEELG